MEQLYHFLNNGIQKLNGVLYGPIMIGIILAVGIYFSIKTHFFQFSKWNLWMKKTILSTGKRAKGKKEKGISQFQALATALAGTMGTGNIVGVATALVMGGPGAIFWMWEHTRLLHIANLPTDKVNDLSELMAAAAGYVSGTSASLAGEVDVRQEQILQSLYSEKNKYEAASESYPIETEKKLQMMILNGDKKGAHDMLNELLAHIYYVSNFDVDIIKIRVIELLVVLSRATIDAGADTKEILWFSTNCIKQMQECVTVEQISVWITQIMHRFVSYSFDFSAVKHSDTVYKVIDYIKQHYFTRITLEDVARHVNFNKTYLSRIFKEETGDSFTTYVNKVRIEKSKLMLLDKSIPLVDVANLAGFEDQSYFTKVFKNLVGISPKRFRECRRKGRV